jgi:L-malate glycosyltransferase
VKILHILYSGLGGHGNVFFSLLNADAQKEFVHQALFNGVEELRDEYRQRCNDSGINFSFIKKKPGFDLSFYKNLVSAIKTANPQVIFLHGSTQVLWAKIAILLKKQKCIIIVRETQANHLKTRQDWFWLSAALLLANKIIFLTREYQLEIKKKLSLFYNSKKIAVIANGIDLSQFKPVLKLENDTVVIGMQSRIVKIKDHKTLLRAFAMLVKDTLITNKKVLLKIVGDGDCREDLQQLTKELEIDKQVEFTGMLTEDQLVNLLAGLDIYVHASFGETMSTAIMQAMACGKPVIASDVPGINNMIINNVTGILVPIADAALLYEKIKSLINTPTIATTLSVNARAYAEKNFSNEIMFKKYRPLF